MNIKIVRPTLKLPRCAGGADYGTERRVVARHGMHIIYWVPGHTDWLHVGARGYFAGHLAYSYADTFSRTERLPEKLRRDRTRLRDLLQDDGVLTWLIEKLQVPGAFDGGGDDGARQIAGKLDIGHSLVIT